MTTTTKKKTTLNDFSKKFYRESEEDFVKNFSIFLDNRIEKWLNDIKKWNYKTLAELKESLN